MLTREKLIDSVLQREFKKAHRIIVDGKHCYRPELFRDKGWCKVTDEVEPYTAGNPKKLSTKWGFCSSSCKVEFMMVFMFNIQ